jgi:hypothetical protein
MAGDSPLMMAYGAEEWRQIVMGRRPSRHRLAMKQAWPEALGHRQEMRHGLLE